MSRSTSTGNHVAVTGPKGKLERDIAPELRIVQEDGSLRVERPNDDKRSRELHGLTRTLLANMVIGVTDGFRKGLEITGVGYRAQLVGKKLQLNLGYSHPIEIDPPGRRQLRGRDTRPPGGRRARQGARRPRRRAGAQHAQAGAVQGQGRPLRRRGRSAARPARPARSEARSEQLAPEPPGRARQAPHAHSPDARGQRPSVRDWPSSAASTRSTPRSSTTPPAARWPVPRRSRTGIRKSSGNKTEHAKAVGTLLAERARDAGVKQVVFDRAGYPLSRPRPCAGRRRARSRARLLEPTRRTFCHGSMQPD